MNTPATVDDMDKPVNDRQPAPVDDSAPELGAAIRKIDELEARIAELEAELKGFEPIDCVPIIAERDRLRAALESAPDDVYDHKAFLRWYNGPLAEALKDE